MQFFAPDQLDDEGHDLEPVIASEFSFIWIKKMKPKNQFLVSKILSFFLVKYLFASPKSMLSLISIV